MKAIGFERHLPITDADSLIEFDAAVPRVGAHDILVAVDAISVNPVDVKVRGGGRGALSHPRVLGWDAYGTVAEVGDAVTLFGEGDKVFYAGAFDRQGSNAQYQLVDERLAGHAPYTLAPEQIAAMPLTGLTAWEALFERLGINPDDRHGNQGKSILIINGAGGVGSVATQLARRSGLEVLATASRPQTREWVQDHGAHHVISHRQPLPTQLKQLGFKWVDYILCLSELDNHWDDICEAIAPNGAVCAISENRKPMDLSKLIRKCATFTWEWMFQKSLYRLPNMISQHDILERISRMLDSGELRPTNTKTYTPINPDNLKLAHADVETNAVIGKITLAKW